MRRSGLDGKFPKRSVQTINFISVGDRIHLKENELRKKNIQASQNKER
jgi:hypothetical protein